jgi:hypothetical protein
LKAPINLNAPDLKKSGAFFIVYCAWHGAASGTPILRKIQPMGHTLLKPN